MQSIDDENKKVVMTYFEYLFENYEQMKIYAHYKGEEYEIHRTVAKQRLKAFHVSSLPSPQYLPLIIAIVSSSRLFIVL